MTEILSRDLAMPAAGMAGGSTASAARFYRLDAAPVSRFYAGRSTLADRFRIYSGKPPVPAGRALAAIGEQAA